MIYFIEPKNLKKEEIIDILIANDEIKFVSFVGIDLGNNRTDERIPIKQFINNYDDFMKNGVQTDGSSVELREIADVDNAKVDIIPDKNVKWVVDYTNPYATNPIGTLKIPSFIYHEKIAVGSRSVLKRGLEQFKNYILKILKDKKLRENLGIKSPVIDVEVTLATELEFWVYSPFMSKDEKSLFVSQSLKEQYWKRPYGKLRSAIEEAMLTLDKYGLKSEMAHKEVGGIRSELQKSNDFKHMEQIEIDWKYDSAMQASDNEWIAKEIVFDIFTRNGLDVTFKAKPINGVAGSGEHHHIGVVVKTKDRSYNLFSPIDMNSHFLSNLGYGAIMGILKHYNLVNPFISATNDAFNRLKPGFEAPVCTVCSLGMSYKLPSRNRTVLIGLVRDNDNPFATRFELRSPNPLSNTYLLASALLTVMIDGIGYSKNKTKDELLKEISKKYGEKGDYLDEVYEFRSELDLFNNYNKEQLDKLFGVPPKTVYENIELFNRSDRSIILNNNIFTDSIINSYLISIKELWIKELIGRVIPKKTELLKSMKMLHQNDLYSEIDEIRYEVIKDEIYNIIKSKIDSVSLIDEIFDSVEKKEFDKTSLLQLELMRRVERLKKLYTEYKMNIVNENLH